MREVVIVGGGVAGLTLGILLRRAAVPVQLWDLAGYPRHRVCGEFLSGQGLETLFDLLPSLKEAVLPVGSARFYSGGEDSGLMPLPKQGASISRSKLDLQLADEFLRCHGQLITARRWEGSFSQAGVVRATGRRLRTQGESWTGVKAHFQGVKLNADLEMHFSDDGYLGISRVHEGANFCALVRGGFDLREYRRRPQEVFARLMGAEPGRLSEAVPNEDSICAVSGVSLAEESAADECSVGDSIRMLPPFTGNGMSMAIESAVAAAPALVAYGRGEMGWDRVLTTVKQGQRARFRKRFGGARVFQWAAGKSWTRSLMLSSLRTVPQVLRMSFALTR